MENKKELKQKLIEKLIKEIEDFKEKLKQKSSDEIIENSYQLVVKDTIIDEMKDKNLDYYELKALLKQKDLLTELYEDWRKADGGFGENISYEMDNSIQIIVAKMIEEKVKSNKESR